MSQINTSIIDSLKTAKEESVLVEIILKDGQLFVPRGEIWAEVMDLKGENWKLLGPHYKGHPLQPYCVRKIYGKLNVVTNDSVHIRGAEADGKYIGTSDPFISIPFESITEVKIYRSN